jgi:hypothetical protein
LHLPTATQPDPTVSFDAPGTCTVTATVAPNNDYLAATTAQSFTVHPAPLTVTTTGLPAGQVGVPYTATLHASGGTGTYTWSASALASFGLVVDSASGAITGTPTAVTASTAITVTVTDAASPPVSTSTTLALSIAPASTTLTITTTSSPDRTVGASYPTTTLTAADGVTPYKWSAAGLPSGLAVNADTGTIAGTPRQAGNFAVTITVTDNNARLPPHRCR